MSLSSESLTFRNTGQRQAAVAADAAPQRASELPLVGRVEGCTDPACQCHGSGGLLIVTASGAQPSTLFLHTHRHLEGRCIGALSLQAGQQPASAGATQLFYGDHLLASLPTSSSSPTRTAVAFQLRELDPLKLRQAGSSPCSLFILHQPTALTAVEAALSKIIPSSAANVAVDREPSGDPFEPAPQLLVHPAGWALGGFLMRSALLRQRSYWRSTDGAQQTIAPAAAPNRDIALAPSRRSLFQQLFLMRGRP